MKIVEAADSFSFADFMKKPLFAHLATSSIQGARESPVWCLWHNEKIWICTDIKNDTFCHRIAADPRCALGIVDFDFSSGVLYHVGFRGTAEIVAFDKVIGSQLFAKYLGTDKAVWPQWHRNFIDDSNARLIKLTPETVVTRDQSYQLNNGS